MWRSSLFLTRMYLSGRRPPTLPATAPRSRSSLNILTPVAWSRTSVSATHDRLPPSEEQLHPRPW